jgi:hypothetical protein
MGEALGFPPLRLASEKTPTDAFRTLAQASLGYFTSILPELSDWERTRATEILKNGGRVITSITTTDTGVTVLITVCEKDSSTEHQVHAHHG